MSVDFTTYRLDFKAIRVIEDKRDKNHKYVVEDVMCVFFDNGHKYWSGLKNELKAAGLRAPSAYNTYKTEQGLIDVATKWQLLQIISYIPHRKNKKDIVKVWLENNSKPKQSIINSKTKSQKPKTEEPKEEPKQTFFNIAEDERDSYICIAFSFLLALVVGYLTKLGILSVFIIVMGIFIAEAVYRYGIDQEYYEPRRREKAKPAPKKIPKRIIETINFIFRHRLMTYDERVEIVNEAVKSGVNLNVIRIHINNQLKSRISSFTNVKLTKCVKCTEIIPEDIDQCPFCGAMQIWPDIKKLTALALSDRVLTDLERRTIVNKAVKNGIKSEEINQFLDDQLNLRLESYTKVDLRDCPHCGAQIPLISDECMYCGKPLEHIVGNNNVAFNITGHEADIIRSENQRVEQERHGIKNCPDCGAPFPLISNICESCGHVLHERDENSLNIKNLLTNMQRSIDRVNKAPKPKVYEIFFYWFYYIILILSVFTFILGIITDSEAGKIISLAGFVTSIIAMGTNAVLSDTKSPVLIADGEYYKARHSYEMFAREIDTLYGDDYEAQKMLGNFSSTIKSLKRERYQNRIKVIRIILISTLAIMGVITYFSTKDDNNTEPAPKNCEEITMPPNTEWILNFSKELKPYPPESGVPDDMSRYLIANKGAELSFVLKQGYTQPVYRWKVSQLELLPGEFTDTEHFYLLGIHLLDSNYRHIATLGECEFSPNLSNKNYNTVIKSGKGHFYIDFWSKHSTSDERILHTIAEEAVYYTIYYTKR